MRRFIRHLSIMLLMVCLCTGMLPRASAAWGSVVFHGNNDKFTMEPGSGYSSTDLFSGFKDAMPGDVLAESITITNHSWDGDYIKLYLRTQPHSAENPLSYSETYEELDGKDQAGIPGKREETLHSTEDFLSRLILRIYSGDTLISESSPGAKDETFFLGSLRRNQSVQLHLELEVPVTLGNTYEDRVGEVDWIFTAESFSDPGKTDVPKTADTILAAVVIMGISGMLFLLILLTGRRRK